MNGQDSISFLTVGSSYLRPIRRLIETLGMILQELAERIAEDAYLISKIVLAGFMAAWFFADSPINRSSSVKETKDGVVKLPCSFATRKGDISYFP